MIHKRGILAYGVAYARAFAVFKAGFNKPYQARAFIKVLIHHAVGEEAKALRYGKRVAGIVLFTLLVVFIIAVHYVPAEHAAVVAGAYHNAAHYCRPRAGAAYNAAGCIYLPKPCKQFGIGAILSYEALGGKILISAREPNARNALHQLQ